ncbi:hypothetical protein DFH09DRAFT_1088443 [Mycena vulgaris]|nr:hypothetical protein DFH09DRAFT_1088443 [Mycena vulgaris]
MLRGAPDLVDCMIDIDEDFRWDSGGDEKSDVLTHSSLKSLCLEGKGALILRSLTLPALEDLTILDFYLPHDDFLAFLTRASSPLKKLWLEITDWPGNTAETVFGLLPTLTDLHLTLSIPLPLLEALGIGFPPQLLPNLRNLLINSHIPPTQAMPAKPWLQARSHASQAMASASQATAWPWLELALASGLKYFKPEPGQQARA